jgi:hypothetical protein
MGEGCFPFLRPTQLPIIPPTPPRAACKIPGKHSAAYTVWGLCPSALRAAAGASTTFNRQQGVSRILWSPPISIFLPPRMCRPRSVNWLVAGTMCIRSVECKPSFSNHIAPHCSLSPSSSCIFSSCYERACFFTRCNRLAHQGASSRIRCECFTRALG